MSAPLPPLVPGLPFVGSLPQMIMNYSKLLLETAPAVGDISRIKVGTNEIYVFSHPEHLQHIMRDEHKKYERGSGMGADAVIRVIGRGLIVLDGQEWLDEHRLMQPYFHKRYLPRVVEIMAETIDRELDKLEQHVDNGIVDMAPIMKHLTLSVFLHAMYSMGLDEEKIDLISSAVETSVRRSFKRDQLSALIPMSIKLPMDKQIDADVALFDKLVNDIIEGRRNSAVEDDDLLGLLINATDEDGNKMSSQQLLDEMKTMVLGGFDTTSGSLLWALYVLEQHPEAAEGILKEAEQVGTSQLTMDMVGELKYTRMVLDETMRLYPVAWANNRKCVEDDIVGGYRIPAGTPLFIPTGRIHRDPRFWDEPDAFKPERWQDDATGGASHRFAYLPFGLG